jgi:hypothetical protein
MREERRIRVYRSPVEHILLIVVFALFIVLVLTLFLIPLFSFTQQQSQTTSVRQATELWLTQGRQRLGTKALCRPVELAAQTGQVKLLRNDMSAVSSIRRFLVSDY